MISNAPLGGYPPALINNRGGLGVPGYDDYNDIFVSWKFAGDFARNAETLEAIYANIWQARKICDLFPKLMGQAWPIITMLSEDKNETIKEDIQKAIDKLKPLFVRGQKIANLYGGSAYVRYTNDSNDLSEPLNIDRVTQIEYSRLFDRWECTPDYVSTQKNPREPEYYQIIPRYTSDEIAGTIVHSSRIIRFRGLELPDKLLLRNSGWEDSILAPVIEPLFRYRSAESHVASSIKSFEFLTFLIENLNEKIKRGRGLETIHQELIEIQRNLSSFRGVGIDKDKTDVKVNSRRYQGVAGILLMVRDEMIAASGLTKVQLYQEHPEGFNATGESERVNEAKDILGLQQEQWEESLTTEIELNEKVYDPQFDQDDPQAGLKWGTIYYSTPTEDSDNRLKDARTDDLNIGNQIYSSDEARQSRYSSHTYKNEIILSDDDPKSNNNMPNDNDNNTQPDKIEDATKGEKTKKEKDETNILRIDGTVIPSSDYDDLLSPEQLAELET